MDFVDRTPLCLRWEKKGAYAPSPCPGFPTLPLLPLYRGKPVQGLAIVLMLL
jgi:hypothetical protein